MNEQIKRNRIKIHQSIKVYLRDFVEKTALRCARPHTVLGVGVLGMLASVVGRYRTLVTFVV